MKIAHSLRPALRDVMSVATLAWFLTACGPKLTAENLQKIHQGMTMDEVEAILGRPAHIDQAETTSLRGETYHYPAANGEGRVVFLNDAVFKAEFIPGDKKS